MINATATKATDGGTLSWRLIHWQYNLPSTQQIIFGRVRLSETESIKRIVSATTIVSITEETRIANRCKRLAPIETAEFSLATARKTKIILTTGQAVRVVLVSGAAGNARASLQLTGAFLPSG